MQNEPGQNEFKKAAEAHYFHRDYVTVFNCLKKAAEMGHVSAQNHLGVCYYKGEGVEQNREEAVKWFAKADANGDKEATYNLGCCYAYGEGIEKNMNVGISLLIEVVDNVVPAYDVLLKLAEQGEAKAKEYVQAYGRSIERDYGDPFGCCLDAVKHFRCWHGTI